MGTRKLKDGEIVRVDRVKSASAVGYLGSVRVILDAVWNDKVGEYDYLTESYFGTGYAWFFESELCSTSA